MRPIDADDLENVVLQLNKKGWAITRGEYKLVDNIIFEFPTIEAEPVKHGRWIRAGESPLYIIECSECRQLFFHHAELSLPKYCSECGTRMDGDVDEAD